MRVRRRGGDSYWRLSPGIAAGRTKTCCHDIEDRQRRNPQRIRGFPMPPEVPNAKGSEPAQAGSEPLHSGRFAGVRGAARLPDGGQGGGKPPCRRRPYAFTVAAAGLLMMASNSRCSEEIRSCTETMLLTRETFSPQKANPRSRLPFMALMRAAAMQ